MTCGRLPNQIRQTLGSSWAPRRESACVLHVKCQKSLHHAHHRLVRACTALLHSFGTSMFMRAQVKSESDSGVKILRQVPFKDVLADN